MVAEVCLAALRAAYLGEHTTKRLPGSMNSGIIERDEGLYDPYPSVKRTILLNTAVNIIVVLKR